MNKNAIKNFAIWARLQLIEAAKQRAFEYEITDGGENKANLETVAGRPLSDAEKKQRSELIARIRQKGYAPVMEEAAYTWFNRFIALRFMEVNGYLPSKIRLFTDENNAFKPEILKECMTVELDGLERARVLELLDKQDNETLYQYLLITQCNALSEVLPVMFERIENWTELLFPKNLLRADSVIGRMISDIPEEDWTDQVQIIGWLYQYYNAEPKDKVFENLKKNIKISKENIPAATQLFTPDWIVRYMVENSLGRLWVEGHPNDELKANWKYYLEEAEQEPEVQAQLAEIRKEYAALKPEEIKVIDPCMGSGHILVYMFDVLVQIYEAYGYNAREAAGLILQNNLYGLDIDDRASQLAYFAVMMKARQYDRRIFSRGIQPHIYAIVESNGIFSGHLSHFGDGMSELERNNAQTQLSGLLDVLHDAKEYGSILTVENYDWELLHHYVFSIQKEEQLTMEAMNAQETQEKLIPLLNVGQALAQKYHVVVTNPPYMGASGMGAKLSDFVKKNYPDSKNDLFAVFIERCGHITVKNGYQAMITQHAWMFLSSFENLRTKLQTVDTVNMAHLGARAFEEIGGEVVQTTAFVMSKRHIHEYKGTYCRLIEPTTQQGKEDMFLSGDNRYTAQQDNFSKIPGSPVAYWVSDAFYQAFSAGTSLEEVAHPKKGLATTDNNRFLRLWHEIAFERAGIGFHDAKSANNSHRKWFPLNKGGEYRRWYGNKEYFVNWENDGQEMKTAIVKRYNGGSYTKEIRSEGKYFKDSVTWSALTAGNSSFRYSDYGALFDSAGSSMFPEEEWKYIIALLNTKVANNILAVINPTMNYGAGSIANLPVVYNNEKKLSIEEIAVQCVEISKTDWDFFETSWDFVTHPLVLLRTTNRFFTVDEKGSFTEPVSFSLKFSFKNWEQECDARFRHLKANEEELNRIFIDIYGLQDELTPEVDDKDVTVRKADLGRDIRSLISYAVGCMFGRYSLDCEGLAYAGGEWDASKYTLFPADKDNIIPICDDDYFDDDITGRFIKWVETVYGKETLEENLKFIADALGGKGTPRDVIRSYFLNDFYADHLKIYQKRPIYWLFDSGKKNGFKALIYMHRYQPDTIARMRTDYVHEQQERYRTQIQMLEETVQSAAASERVKLSKQLTKLKEQALEIRQYEEKIHHLADQMIPIDLDDGVKVNYAKFEDVLAKIK